MLDALGRADRGAMPVSLEDRIFARTKGMIGAEASGFRLPASRPTINIRRVAWHSNPTRLAAALGLAFVGTIGAIMLSVGTQNSGSASSEVAIAQQLEQIDATISAATTSSWNSDLGTAINDIDTELARLESGGDFWTSNNLDDLSDKGSVQ